MELTNRGERLGSLVTGRIDLRMLFGQRAEKTPGWIGSKPVSRAGMEPLRAVSFAEPWR
jgi:hypothetical protein